MPRLPRLHVPGAMYHVTARGNHRQDLFYKHGDRELLDTIMCEALERTGARIHAYCWMTNHLHLLVQVAAQPLGRLMQRVGTRFARHIQRGLSTTGHLFENRYHAVLVDVDRYFLELLRYIHMNPVRARIVERPDQYRWSSHRVYLGKTQQSWIHTDFGLQLFSADQQRARLLYREFVEASHGPNGSPLSDTHPRDRRVLGDDGFIQRLALPSSSRKPQRPLEVIAGEICSDSGISVEAVRSATRCRHVSRVRALIALRAINDHAITLSEVARYLNRSASAISRLLMRHQ